MGETFMSKSIIAALCAAGLVACGSSQPKEASEPVTTTTTEPADTAPPAEPAPAEDPHQVDDPETPPGLSVMTMLGSGKVAAGADVDPASGKELFEQFLDSFLQLANEMAAAADCAGVVAAVDAWREKAVPVLRANFPAMNAYANSLDDAAKQAMQEKMKGMAEGFSKGIQTCGSDPALGEAFARVEKELSAIEAEQSTDE
jgi:hypothetical protein